VRAASVQQGPGRCSAFQGQIKASYFQEWESSSLSNFAVNILLHVVVRKAMNIFFRVAVNPVAPEVDQQHSSDGRTYGQKTIRI
jgi:hypothetical protein